MHELERESVEVLRNISTVNSLREQLAASEHVRWSDFAQAISDMQNREDVLWLAINGEGCDESSVPELTHEEVSRWHQLMGDTIEAMHDGVQPRDERGRELAARFERLGGIRHLAVDKTGTLTRNRPEVTAIVAAHGFDDAQVLAWAAAVEQHSTHPLAAAIAAAGRGTPAAQDVAEEAGHGIGGLVDGRRVAVGSPRWIDAGPLKARVEDLEAEGQTCVLVTVDGFLAGAIGVRDELRPEVPEVVRTLRDQGVKVSMLTGDNFHTAAALAKLAGIGDVHAELRPEDKARIVAGFSETSPTAMIGDGINDAPALAGATVGIAMGATCSDAAIESADVAFTGHDLGLIPQALHHARRGGRIINQNIVLSLAIITVLPPLAITGVLGLAAVVLVHEVAEVVVIANGLRAARARKQ